MIEPKKLNIAMLGHKRIPSREGGIEIVVEELSTRMSQRGHRVTCYNRSGHHVSGAEYDSTTDMKKYKNITLKTVPTINIKGIAAVSSSFFAFMLRGLPHFAGFLSFLESVWSLRYMDLTGAVRNGKENLAQSISISVKKWQ